MEILKLDDIHIDFSSIDGREKPINIVMTSRHDGKTTTFLLKKHLPQWRKTRSPLVLLFRNIADIKPSSVEYYANLMNPFLEKKIKLKISEQACKDGIATAYWDKEPFFIAVALSVKEATLKKTAFPNVKYILFDELEINPKNGEKYLKNEFNKFQAFFDTQRKVSDAKFYGLTNPYSLVNPYFTGLGVDTRSLKLGTMLTGDNWAVWYKRMNPLLVKKIQEENPLYSEEGEYAKMAFSGIAVNDVNNHVRPMVGRYQLNLLFSFSGVKYGVYKLANPLDESNPYYYIKEEKDYSKRRGVYAFDFDDLVNNCLLASSADKNAFAHLKRALRNQDVAFDKLESEYAFREIFDYL